jgi:hypothetical protein
MDTADYALIISLVSFGVSILNELINLYYYKERLRVEREKLAKVNGEKDVRKRKRSLLFRRTNND